MVGEAIRDNSEFGIVLAKDDGIVNAGCTVMVEKVLQMYPDGRMDILTRGQRRFEIVSLNEEKELPAGRSELLRRRRFRAAAARAARPGARPLSSTCARLAVGREHGAAGPERPAGQLPTGAGGAGPGLSERPAAAALRDPRGCSSSTISWPNTSRGRGPSSG